MDDDQALTVPKDKQKVAVHLKDGTRLNGAIFLDHLLDDLPFHEKMEHFLERGNRFFPLAIAETGRVEFIYKMSVRMVSVVHPVEAASEADLIELMVMVHITAVFQDGSAMDGVLIADLPQDKARLSDCLNLPNHFLCLRSGKTFIYLNKDALQKVVYKGAVPRTRKPRERKKKH